MECKIEFNAVRSPLAAADRLKFRAIIVSDVHKRDVLDAFVLQHVVSAEHYLWRCQLRFHWIKDTDNLHIAHCSGNEILIAAN